MKQSDMPPDKLGTCTSCGAPGLWCVTDRDKPILVELDEGSEGNLRISIEGGKLVARVKSVRTSFGATDLHKPHFATCPHAGRWRKPRKDTRRA